MSASASFEQHHHPKRRPPLPWSSSDHHQQRGSCCMRLSVQQQEDDVAAGVVPPVTVVLEGHAICHRVHLSRHTGYRSLADALRRMLVDDTDNAEENGGLDLSDVVPGHVVTYEDMEDDLSTGRISSSSRRGSG